MDCTSFSTDKGLCKYKIYIRLERGTIQAKAKYIQHYHELYMDPLVAAGECWQELPGFHEFRFTEDVLTWWGGPCELGKYGLWIAGSRKVVLLSHQHECLCC